MATKIRLARFGSKKRAFYRMVVADGRFSRDGRYIEVLGQYDPKLGIANANIKADRVKHWLACGAQPTDTARDIIRKIVPNQ